MVKVVYISLMAVCIAGAVYSPVLGAPISQPFEQQDAARADASLRQRADVPARAALLRSDGSNMDTYRSMDSTPKTDLPEEDISFPVEHIIVTSREKTLQTFERDRLDKIIDDY